MLEPDIATTLFGIVITRFIGDAEGSVLQWGQRRRGVHCRGAREGGECTAEGPEKEGSALQRQRGQRKRGVHCRGARETIALLVNLKHKTCI